MPTYDYRCETEGCIAVSTFELVRSIDARYSPAECPHCGELCNRILKMPALKSLDPNVSMAIDRNVKSRFEPKEYNPSKGLIDEGVPPSHRPKKRKRSYKGPRSWVVESAKSSI